MFKPDIYVESVFDIDYKNLQNKGIKLLCFDLDNTLDEPDNITVVIKPEINELLDQLNKNFEVILISNNNIKNRVASFADIRGMYYIESARKPFRKTYKKDKVINNYTNSEMAFVGDKIVTDIIGAKRNKSVAILVDPLYPKNAHWYSVIMKISETIFCSLVRFKKGRYYDKV